MFHVVVISHFVTCLLLNVTVLNMFSATNRNDIVFTIKTNDPTKNPHQVHFLKAREDVTVDCSCKQFSAIGWLCFHALKVLTMQNETKIPQKYINKRWAKGIKQPGWNKVYQGKSITQGENVVNEENDEALPWRRLMSRKFYELLTSCSSNHDARRLVKTLVLKLFVSVLIIYNCLNSVKQEWLF